MEDFYVIPETYFSKEAAEHYDHSPRMRKVQREITERAIELLGLAGGRVLDAGCGTGFSLEVLKERGFDAVGVDVSQPMVDIAKKKGLNVVKADFMELPFKDGEFDGIVSISALQWIYGKSYDDVADKYSRVGREFHRVLRKGGRAVVQLYPTTVNIINVARMFKKAGFGVDVATDYPDVKRKSKSYILLGRY